MPFTIHEEWHGDRIQILAAGRRGVRSAAQRLLALSQPKVPIDTGRLRSSGRAQGVGMGRDGMAAEVSYDTEYAVYQHEGLDYNHDEGQAKFLEEPLNASRQELLGIIAEEVRGAIRNA